MENEQEIQFNNDEINNNNINFPEEEEEKNNSKNTFITTKDDIVQIESYEEENIKNNKEDDFELPKFTEEELKNSYIDFIKKKVIPPYLMRPFIIDYAKRQSLKSLISENYDEAAKKNKIINELQNIFNNDQGQFESESKNKIYEQRLEQTIEYKKKLNEKWKKEINKIKEEEKKKIEKLILEQTEEKDQFEKQCQGPEYLLKFSKHSKELLHLKKMQKSLALAHDFDGAKKIKITADQKQLEETEQAKLKAIESVKLNYLLLIEKHEKSLDCAKKLSDRKIFELEVEMSKEIESIDNLIKQLQFNSKEQKPRNLSSLPLLNNKTVIPTNAIKQISKFRRSPNKLKLDVKIINIKNILNKQNISLNSNRSSQKKTI